MASSSGRSSGRRCAIIPVAFSRPGLAKVPFSAACRGATFSSSGRFPSIITPPSCTSAIWRGVARRVQVFPDRGAPLGERAVGHLVQLFRVVVQKGVLVQAIREMVGACASQGQHDERLETALDARVKSLPERAERRRCSHG